MKSMTGYGRATAVVDNFTLTVQVSSVNRKTLDLSVRLPDAWTNLETKVNEEVRKYALRGRVSVVIELTGARRVRGSLWDEAEIGVALDELESLAETRGIRFEPTTQLLWSIATSQRANQEFPEAEATAPKILATLADALREFAAMRAMEGEALLIDSLSRLATLRRFVDAVAGRAPAIPGLYREQLMQRLRQAGLELDLADERLLKEIALFADRCDISEELTRLRSHFEQFAILLKVEGEIGRKAEFLLQEIGREVNTIGSKANDLTISRAVIEMKNELERVREQIANVE